VGGGLIAIKAKSETLGEKGKKMRWFNSEIKEKLQGSEGKTLMNEVKGQERKEELPLQG